MHTRFSKFVSGKGMILFFYSFVIFTIIYISFRAGQLLQPLLGSSAARWLTAIQALLFALYLYLHKKPHTTSFRRSFAKMIAVLFCFALYFILLLVGSDIVGCIINTIVRGNAFSPDARFLFAFVSALALVIYGMLHAQKLTMPQYHIKMGTDVKKYQIIQLSDLHIGIFIGAEYIERVVRKINACAPDMVVITGDIFNSSAMAECVELEKIREALKQIRAKDGVFAILGNHDPSALDPELITLFQYANIKLLQDEVQETTQFYLVGRNDISSSAHGRRPLNQLTSSLSDRKPVLVLDHNPSGIREAAECGADLILCGHTHKGQMFPLTYFTRLFQDEHCFYGYSTFGKTQTVISAGTGYFQLPVRIGTNSEIVRIFIY